MSEILGLIDSIEATILEAKRIPITNKIVLDEHKILPILDKVRLAVKCNGNSVKDAIDRTVRSEEIPTPDHSESLSGADLEGQLVLEANQESDRIRNGANAYADNVLASLQVMVTKLQRNLVRLEQNIESGREVLDTEKKTEEFLPEGAINEIE